jgi:hypothetical protein
MRVQINTNHQNVSKTLSSTNGETSSLNKEIEAELEISRLFYNKGIHSCTTALTHLKKQLDDVAQLDTSLNSQSAINKPNEKNVFAIIDLLIKLKRDNSRTIN